MSFQFYSLSRYGALLAIAIYLARFLPDQTLISRYEFLLLLGGSITFFWVSGLYDAFVVAFRNSQPKDQIGYTAATLKLAVGFALPSGIAVYLMGYFLFPDRVDPQELLAYSSFIGLDTLAMSLIYMLLVHKAHQKLMLVATLSSLAYIGAMLLVPFEGGFATSFWILAGLAIIKLGLLLWWIPYRGQGTAGASLHLYRLGGPLALAALLSHSATYMDSFLVDHFFADQFTNFRYGARELPLILLLANGLSIVRSGDIAQGLNEGRLGETLALLREGSQRLIYWLFPLSLLLLLLSDFLFTSVFGKDFQGAVPVFDVYLLLVIPRLIFPQSVVRAHQKTQWMTWSSLVELILNLTLSLVGLYYWGLVGIAGATVVAYSVEKLVLVVLTKRKLGISPLAYTPLLEWLIGSGLLFLAWIVKYTFL